MDAHMVQPLTLAVDIDVLLSSASPVNEFSGGPGTDPSFSFSIGERPSSASVSASPPSTGNLTFTQQEAASNGYSIQMHHAWLRPGVRRFLLAVNPHSKTVLLVRSRCTSRRCGCCCGAACSASVDGGRGSRRFSSSGGSSGINCDGSRPVWEQGVGGCAAALLSAALPYIDPDGQFFGGRVILVQDRPRPRTAQAKLTRVSCPGDTPTAVPAATATAAGAACSGAAPNPPPLSAAPSYPAGAVCDLGALPTALGGQPSAILIATTADRALFGGLAEQVVQCQPYRKEYGKYDDVLDCLASVVSEMLAEPSVPQGLRRLGLLHSKLQPSPMMQALHAQAALRHAQQRQQQQQQQPPGGRRPNCRQRTSQQPQQTSQAAAPVTAAVAASARKTASASAASSASSAIAAVAAGSRAGRRSGGNRRESDEGSGERGSGGGGGAARVATTVTAISASASPLPPIPELPLLEVGSDWPGSEAQCEESENDLTTPAAAAVAAALGPCSDRSSAATSASSNCASVGPQAQNERTQQTQSRSMSSPPALCAATQDASTGAGHPSRSSAGSSSSCGSGRSSAAAAMTGAAAATMGLSPPPPLLHGGRRMAWDAAAASPGSLVDRVDPSAASTMLQSLKRPSRGSATAPTAAATGGGGGVFSHARISGSGGGFDWRPSSFPAAAKPHVTRHISDCASPSAGAAAAVAVAAAAPASPLSTAANALATATSRLISSILGGRRQRRCRPSDVGDSGGGVGVPAAASAATACTVRSPASATQASRAWSLNGDSGSFVNSVLPHQGRSASASAAQTPFVVTASGGLARAAVAATCLSAPPPPPQSPPYSLDKLSVSPAAASAASGSGNDNGAVISTPGSVTDAAPSRAGALSISAVSRPGAASPSAAPFSPPPSLAPPSRHLPSRTAPGGVPTGSRQPSAGCRSPECGSRGTRTGAVTKSSLAGTALEDPAQAPALPHGGYLESPRCKADTAVACLLTPHPEGRMPEVLGDEMWLAAPGRVEEFGGGDVAGSNGSVRCASTAGVLPEVALVPGPAAGTVGVAAAVAAPAPAAPPFRAAAAAY